MDDPETFVTEVYLLVDERLPALLAHHPKQRGPVPALSPAEVITLALVSRVAMARSGRAFYRFASKHFRPLFPRLPHRTQYLRQVLRWRHVIAQLALELADDLAAGTMPAYEILDSTAVPTRNRCRRGAGWLADTADIGSSSRLIWYEGVHLLTSVSPDGVVTGFGCAPASVNDRRLAEDFFATRAGGVSLAPTAGHALTGYYLADMGFGGADCERRWHDQYGAHLLCRPQPDRKTRIWSEETGRWTDRHRQRIESVFGRLQWAFNLGRDRPHTRAGVLATIATVMAIHNLTIMLNRRHGRGGLTYADLVDW